MMSDPSDHDSPLLGGAGSTVLGVLGGALCSLAWVGIALVVLRRGIGHNRLILRSSRSTKAP